MKKILFLIALFTLVGGVNSVKAEEEGTKTPIILSGGKLAECFTSGTYGIQMQGWQQFIAYEDATGVSFDENSYMQFDLAEAVSNGEVRVTFTFSDESTQEAWWCLGIGENPDDESTPYNHDFDNSKYWLKKGLGANFETKKTLNIKKVVVQNFNYDSGNSVVTYKVNGGTFCGEAMTLKQGTAKAFGAIGGVFSATDAYTNIFQMKNFEVGDYDKIVIKFGAAVPAAGSWNLNNNGGLTNLGGKTEFEFALDGTPITDFTIFNYGTTNPPSINISEVYFFKSANIEATEIYEAPAGTTDLNDLTGTNTGWSVKYPKELGQAAVFCGDGDGSNEGTHVTITGKDYICFEVTGVKNSGQQLRVWIWDGSVKTLYAYPIADYKTATWTTANTISATGTYVVNVSGYNYLKGVKTDWGGTANSITISQAYTASGDPIAYVPTGKYKLSGKFTGSASLTAALADANAVYYDATGVTGTSVDLTSVTNPNALFKANSGALSNTNNVIIDGTCANLVLTDGNYPFKAPAGFTATNVSYNRTFAENQASTVCLPFALTQDECDAAGKFYELTAYDGTTLTFTQITSGGTTAYKPYLFRAEEDGKPFNSYAAVNKPVSASDALSVTVGSGETATMTGTLTHQSVNGKYGWNSDDGVFSIAEDAAVTIDPFRAYISITGESLARVATLFVDSSVTGINEVSNSEDIKGVKNFEGKIFENGKIIIFKKGMKFNANGQLIK